MEEKEGNFSSGVTVKGNEINENYRTVQMSEPSNGFNGSTAAIVPANLMSVVALPSTEVKKKRGRPKKYGPDGPAKVALSPMPISASIPLSGDFSGLKNSGSRPVESFKKKQKFELGSAGERVAHSVGAKFSPHAAYSGGANFTPHVITVNAGEDVNMKIISFAQQGSRSVCVLAANGAISNVTLSQPSSSGGTLTYEGRYEILSLTGSFMPSDNGVTKSITGGMSVSLSGPDGRVIGGGLAGMLIAAGPIQVVIGSFISGQPQEQNPKKQRFEHTPAFTAIPASPVYQEHSNGAYSRPSPNFVTSTPFPGDNAASLNSIHNSGISTTENNIPMHRDESREHSPSS